MMKKETGLETGAQRWLESNGDVGDITSVKSSLQDKHGESASAHRFSVKSVTKLALAHIS